MRILFLTHSFNSLTQRLFVELREYGHEVSIEFDIHEAVTIEAVDLYQPDLIVAPFLKRAIPEVVWQSYTCWVIHPGPPGDRGPSALDWAILNGEREWGVTVLQANGEMDGGDIWAAATFPMRAATKSSLYRNEVTETAVEALLLALERFQSGSYQPQPLSSEEGAYAIQGCWHPLMKQQDRAIDWQQDDTEMVLCKMRSGDGFPGLQFTVMGRELRLFDAHPDLQRSGPAGEVVARSDRAICIATMDGAIWVGQLLDRESETPFKLPALQLLGEVLQDVPAVEHEVDLYYEEEGDVGYLHFPFYNGVMGTVQCHRLLGAYRDACMRDTRAIVLMGGPDFWSNGMDLNQIEAAESPADASWENIHAIDDLAQAIIETDSHLIISALQGSAGAGGVFLARAADQVWARAGVILNPHYKDMGNLYGSEYWSYLLPRYAGEKNARHITEARLPMGVVEAQRLGLVDRIFSNAHAEFIAEVKVEVQQWVLKADPLLEQKRVQRRKDEAEKPLQQYREEELAQMQRNFYGFDSSYHVARYNFVHKVPKSRTPLTLALHRRK